MKKFKKGDLVMLSSAGKKRSGNWRCRGGFGFVKKVGRKPQRNGRTYPIQCEWWNEDMENFRQPFKAYELKRFKKPDKK